MPGSLSFATPSTLDYFASLVADDRSLPVLEAAIAVAQDEDPKLDVQGTLAQVDELGERLRRRIPRDAAPLQRLRLLNPYFFHELGFAGNVNNFYDPANSLIPRVLETRRGIPITLALLYIEIAARLGLSAQGVAFPGHYLIKLKMPLGEIVIDPFNGRSLGREELDERLLPFRQARGLAAEEDTPLGLFLQAATGRETIARLLANLKELYRSGQDGRRLADVQRRLVVLLPQAFGERRELAFALAQSGCLAQAAEALADYLRHCPEADDAAALSLQMQAWQHLQ